MPRINQLPAASSVASTDVVAVDTPNKTYRVPKSTLFNGYYTSAEVDAAIQQSTEKLNLFFGQTVDTWAEIYPIITKIPVNSSALFVAHQNCAPILSDGNISTAAKGIINRPAAGLFDILAYTGYYTEWMWVWRISNFTSASVTPTISVVERYDSAVYHVGDTLKFDGAQVPFRSLGDKSAIYFAVRMPKIIGSDITSFNITITTSSNTWYTGSTASNLSIGQITSSSTIANKTIGNNRNAIKFSATTTQTPAANAGIGICELFATITFT